MMSETPKANLVVSGTQYRPPMPMDLGPIPEATATIVSSDSEGESLSMQQILLAFRRNRLLVFSMVVICLGAAVLYTKYARPVYKSMATLRINDKDAGTSLLAGVPLGGFGGN